MGLENEIYIQYHVDNVRIQILEEEIRYYRTLIEEHDCGHIYTTINFLQQRFEQLTGKKK